MATAEELEKFNQASKEYFAAVEKRQQWTHKYLSGKSGPFPDAVAWQEVHAIDEEIKTSGARYLKCRARLQPKA